MCDIGGVGYNERMDQYEADGMERLVDIDNE
jgi:hypothetical protein